MNLHGQQSGFIKLIILLVLVFITISYLGFLPQKAITPVEAEGSSSYVRDVVQYVWTNAVVAPVTFIWDKIIIGFFWNTLLAIFEKIQALILEGVNAVSKTGA